MIKNWAAISDEAVLAELHPVFDDEMVGNPIGRPGTGEGPTVLNWDIISYCLVYTLRSNTTHLSPVWPHPVGTQAAKLMSIKITFPVSHQPWGKAREECTSALGSDRLPSFDYWVQVNRTHFKSLGT